MEAAAQWTAVGIGESKLVEEVDLQMGLEGPCD